VKRQLFLASGAAALTAATGRSRAEAAGKSIFLQPSLRDKLATRAERTDFRETSTYADVMEFLDALDRRGAPIFRGTLGTSVQGRDIPFVVASRPRITSPREARESGRAIVYLQANIHGGEVEGKEALLAMLRDLCVSTEKTLLDDLVLLIVPIYNPDGNEHFAEEAVNRPEQNGPARIGARPNGAGLDLNRDYVKAEAPETRGFLEFIHAWNPDVMIDCHATDGSYSGYALTYAPSLHPAAFGGGPYARDTILPDVRAQMQDKFGLTTFDYGNFGRTKTLTLPAPSNNAREYGWFTYDYRPRFGTNYFGLRGRIAILSEAYSHDTFERRVFATRAFVETTLGFISAKDDQIIRVSQLGDNYIGGPIPTRATFPLTPPRMESVQWEQLSSDPTGGEPGLPPGVRRSGSFSAAVMPVYDRFAGAAFVQPKGYLIRYKDTLTLLPLLKRHGILYEQLVSPVKYRGRTYFVSRVDRAPTPFEGHHEVTLSGRWTDLADVATKFGDVHVPINQTLGPLAACLLEPEAADSFATWGLLDANIAVGAPYPAIRLE
jgi:hypothetical protein